MMGLGMPEVVLILVIALIVFGPRKLPELGKSLGQAMNQFRRASDEFKRTWEQEVEYDKVRKDAPAVSAASSAASSYDSGYSADSDYQYGYDSTASSDSSSTTESPNVSTENNVEPVPVVTEKKAEPQWI